MKSTKEQASQEEEGSGSTVMLTGHITFSDKLLALASPPKQRPRFHWDLRGTAPGIGAVWYLLGMWPFHLYLEYHCFTELTLQAESHVVTAVQVLLTLSLVALLLFSVSFFLKLECQLTSSVEGTQGCHLQKCPLISHVMRALKSQQYSLHGLAALLLMISASLLQLGRQEPQHPTPVGKAGLMNATGLEASTNRSESRQGLLPHILLEGAGFGSTLLCLNVLVPLFFHSMVESDPVWRRKRLWGISYSTMLVLASVKSVSSSLTFDALYTMSTGAPHPYILFVSSLWVPLLYVLSLVSLFLFCLSLKIYVELSCPEPGGSPPGVKLRRKAQPCPSPIALLLTTAGEVACDVPLLVELYCLFLETTDVHLILLWAFNLSFCLVCVGICLGVCLRKSYRSHRARAKKERPASGLCLAHSFVYQTSKHGASTKC